MLNSEGNAAFSNFWMDQDSRVSFITKHSNYRSSLIHHHPLPPLPIQGYYKRHEDYLPILQRNFTGCFRAPVLLPPLLIQLSSPQSQALVYHPPLEGFDGPTDDIVHFAYSAKIGGMQVSLFFFLPSASPFLFPALTRSFSLFVFL